MIVNTGLDYFLDVTLSNATQNDPHYVGLKGAGAVAAGDTLASPGAWSEVTDYTGNRKEWDEQGVSGQSISNSGSAAEFSINGSCTVAGAFIATVSSGTGGTLVAAVDFSGSRSLQNGDTLNVTYTITAADDGV